MTQRLKNVLSVHDSRRKFPSFHWAPWLLLSFKTQPANQTSLVMLQAGVHRYQDSRVDCSVSLKLTDNRQFIVRIHHGRPFGSKRGWGSHQPNFCWRRTGCMLLTSPSVFTYYLNSWSFIVAGASDGQEVCGDFGSFCAEGAFRNIIWYGKVSMKVFGCIVWVCCFWFHSYFKSVVLHNNCSFRFTSTIRMAIQGWCCYLKEIWVCPDWMFVFWPRSFFSSHFMNLRWFSVNDFIGPGRNFTNHVPQPETQGALLSGFEPLVNRNLSLASGFSTGFAARPWGSNVFVGKFVFSAVVCRHFN